MEHQYEGYKAVHEVSNRIFSYSAPCSLEIDDLIIAKKENGLLYCKLTYYSKNPLIVSAFFNATEYENCEYNLTEKILTCEQNSFEKHMLCKKGSNKSVQFEVPILLSELLNIPLNHKNPFILDQRYHIIIRIEPKGYKHRFVKMYYLELQDRQDSVNVQLLKEKQEIEQKAFYIFDIYGLENLKKFKMHQDQLNTFCNICLDKQIAVIIIPCRHMCLCLDCAKEYNKKKPNGKPLIEPECPMCRQQIKSFINIQGLEIKSE